MKNFIQLKKNLKKDRSRLKTIKVALLGDTATQFLAQAIIGLGYDRGFNLELWEADFNQIKNQVYDLSSNLYEFGPSMVIIFQSSHKLLDNYNKLDPQEHGTLASNELDTIESIYSNLTNRLTAQVIYYNYTEIDDAVFGNFANKTATSFLYQLRKLNFELMAFASKSPNLAVCDLSSIQNQVGKSTLFQPALYASSEMVLSIDVLPRVAVKTLDVIGALSGKFKKCIILDLDNTIWGGIIGDDGIENIQLGSLGIGKAFSELQYWVKKLKNRGIIVAICSKNDEEVAKRPFIDHPDMTLRLADISVFKANWGNKADNIRQIQSILNIGFDAMVFLDDNPFERNMVRENIPEICVPELPEDPTNYLEYLYSLNLFETVSFSNADTDRTEQYQLEAERAKDHKKFTNVDDFLKKLGMISQIEPFNAFNTPRVAQLSQRSNQFNLRTIRYTDADIVKISQSDDYATFSFTLEDKFGSSGLICAIIVHKQDTAALFIESWFMSCRVLKRGMENFVLNTLVDFAKKIGCTQLIGEYLPTEKNGIVKDHYSDLGFIKKDGNFILEIKNYHNKKSYIKVKE